MTLILGSPLYMAPELVKKQVYDHKVDIWAVGCITYLLLTGHTPFESNTVQKIHKNTLYKEVMFEGVKWEKISGAAKSFIRRCLDRDIEKRPSAGALLDCHRWFRDEQNEIL